jgi:hypothetical protein
MMRVAQTVWASYRLLFANFGAFLQIAIRWALLATLASATAQLPWGAKLPEHDDIYLVALAPFLLTFVFSVAGSICLAIVWHRFVILGEPVTRFFPADRDVIGPYFVRASISMLAPISFYLIVTRAYWDDTEDTAVDAALYAGMTLLLSVGARLWLALPASAVGDRATTFRESWRATQGHGLAMFAGLLACNLPLTIIEFGVDYLTTDYEVFSLEATAAFAAMQVLDLARNAVWTAFISFAYLEFVRPTQAQADHFR